MRDSTALVLEQDGKLRFQLKLALPKDSQVRRDIQEQRQNHLEKGLAQKLKHCLNLNIENRELLINLTVV